MKIPFIKKVKKYHIRYKGKIDNDKWSDVDRLALLISLEDKKRQMKKDLKKLHRNEFVRKQIVEKIRRYEIFGNVKERDIQFKIKKIDIKFSEGSIKFIFDFILIVKELITNAAATVTVAPILITLKNYIDESIIKKLAPSSILTTTNLPSIHPANNNKRNTILLIFTIIITAIISIPYLAKYRPEIENIAESKPSLEDKTNISALILRKIEHDIISQQNIKLFFITDSFPQHSVFLLLGEIPPKLVIDLLGNWKNNSKRTRLDLENTKIAERIRIGEHDDKLRIVIDLKSKTVYPTYITKKLDHGFSLEVYLTNRN